MHQLPAFERLLAQNGEYAYRNSEASLSASQVA